MLCHGNALPVLKPGGHYAIMATWLQHMCIHCHCTWDQIALWCMKVLANLIARGWCTGFAKWAGMNAAATCAAGDGQCKLKAPTNQEHETRTCSFNFQGSGKANNEAKRRVRHISGEFVLSALAHVFCLNLMRDPKGPRAPKPQGLQLPEEPKVSRPQKP